MHVLIKYCFAVYLCVFVTACGSNEIPQAIPGEIYSHKATNIRVMLSNKEILSTNFTYEWKICDEEVFVKEVKYFYLDTLNLRIDLELNKIIRDLPTKALSFSEFYTDVAIENIENIFSDNLRKIGLCIDKFNMLSV